MKKHIFSIMFIFAIHAHAADIATIMGSPDASLDFVKTLIVEQESLHSDTSESQISTAVYSVLARRDVQTAYNVDIVSENGSASLEHLLKAIDLAAKKSPVIFIMVGGYDNTLNQLCIYMSSFKNNIFVPVTSTGSLKFSDSEYPSCTSENILFVGSYDYSLKRLIDTSNFGQDIFKLAAQSVDIRVTVPGDRSERLSGNTVAASLVAGRLASFVRMHPQMPVAEALKHFYEKATVTQPSLNGKIQNSRLLSDFGF